MSKRLGLIAVTLLLVAMVVVSGSVLILRVFYTWLLVLVSGYFWVVFTSRGIGFAAAPLPLRSQAGASILQQVSVTNKSRLPKSGLQIHASNDIACGDISTTLDLPPGKTVTWQAQYDLTRRGRFHLGGFRLSATDPFGLFRREVTEGLSSEIIVHPMVVPMPPFSLLGLNGSGLSKRMPEALSASASNIREYTNGDSLRHIHWRSTAHTGRYMVKVFDADRSRHRAENYWVLLDMGTSGHASQGNDSTAEYAVALAASLAREYISNGYRFGLITTGGEPKVFPADASHDHLTNILDTLAIIEPSGFLSCPELLARHQGLFGSNSTVIIITPTTSSSLTESFHQLNSRGCAAAYFLIDGADFGGASPSAVGRTLTQLGAPVYVLRRNVTFRQALEQAAGANSWFSGAERS